MIFVFYEEQFPLEKKLTMKHICFQQVSQTLQINLLKCKKKIKVIK